MFTGIIESMGEVLGIEKEGTNVHFKLKSQFTSELKVDQSLCHDGVCLTVTRIEGDQYWVTAVIETLERSNLKHWHEGYRPNLERSMKADGRFDGHIVQGHVDQTAIVEKIIEEDGSWRVYFTYSESENITVEKGSITVNGVSLTVVDSGSGSFSVAIIPYTWEHTNFGHFQKGTEVNIEFDIVGKYVQKMLRKA